MSDIRRISVPRWGLRTAARRLFLRLGRYLPPTALADLRVVLGYLELGVWASHIDDPRVAFEVGLFDQTLRDFEPPDHDQLIINIDCDLYESTDAVLRWAEPHIRTGTLIYFDELPDRDHELRALRDHLSRTGREIEALGITGGGLHWALPLSG